MALAALQGLRSQAAPDPPRRRRAPGVRAAARTARRCACPRVLVAGTAGPDAALLVTRPLEGAPLADADAKALTDKRLADAVGPAPPRCTRRTWSTARSNARHLVITPKGIGIDDFSQASGAASPERRGSDVAELLVSTAAIVGNDRAVKAAVTGMGKRGDRGRAPLPADGGAQPRDAPAQAPRQEGARQRACGAAGGSGEGRRHRGAGAPAALPRQRDEPAHGRRHPDRGVRAAEPDRRPRGVLRDDQERRLGVARRRARHLVPHQLRDRGLAVGHRADQPAACCAPRSCSSRCRSRTSRCPRSAAWRRRSASCRSRASTSRRPSRPVGCSRTSATSPPA